MSKMGTLALEILEQESREAGVSDSDNARVHFRHTPAHYQSENSHLPTALMPVEMVQPPVTETLRTVKYFQPGLRDTVNGETIQDAATFWHDRVCTAVMPYGINQYGVVIQNDSAKIWEKPVVEITPLVFFPNNKTVCYFTDGIWQQVMLHPMFTPLREDEMPEKVSRYVKDMRWGMIIRPEIARQVVKESPSQPKAQSTVAADQCARIEEAGKFKLSSLGISEIEKVMSVAGSEPKKSVGCCLPSCLGVTQIPETDDEFACSACGLLQNAADAIPF